MAGALRTGRQHPSMALPPGTLLGGFVVERVIGEGGFGVVYAARDPALERTVAIKELLPRAMVRRQADGSITLVHQKYENLFFESLSFFISEAKLLAGFDHPSLVKVHRFWEQQGTAYIVMPYYEGFTVATFKHEVGGALPEHWIKRILGQAVDALTVLHARKCYHRDISPENILLTTEERRAVILDFGAAKKILEDRHAVPSGGAVVLREGYAPIEQYEQVASLKQGPWTDVYALAATAYFLIFGAKPASSLSRWSTKDRSNPFAAADGLYSEGFLDGLWQSMAVHPDARPESLEAFSALLGLPADASSLSLRATEMRPSFDVSALSLEDATMPSVRHRRLERRQPPRTKSVKKVTPRAQHIETVVVVALVLVLLVVLMIFRYSDT